MAQQQQPKKTQAEIDEEERKKRESALPPPAVTAADKADMSRYANQAEAQHAIENDRPPWVDFVNPDGSWHINYEYRGGVPDWWRDHSTNKAIDNYTAEYDALKKQLEELQLAQSGQGQASAGMPGGGGGGQFRPGRPEDLSTFLSVANDVSAGVRQQQGQGAWNRVFPGAPQPRFSPYMPPQLPVYNTQSRNPYQAGYEYPALGVEQGAPVSTASPQQPQWYERFTNQQPVRRAWSNW